uniref:Glycosyl hydrolase family 38 C-terminal domain-containing protein n=1 Tax=Glossina palpalis gambiensis TaxID=67801 RepID=A0A1B0B0T2_9MUSC
MSLQEITNLKNGELLLNISLCEGIQNLMVNSKNWLITLYNPLTRRATHYVRVPVTYGSYKVEDTKELKLRKLNHYHIKSYADHNDFHPSVEFSFRGLSDEAEEIVVENSLIKLFFDDNGLLTKVEMNNISHKVSQTVRDCESETCQNSGSHIYAANNSKYINILMTGFPRCYVFMKV